MWWKLWEQRQAMMMSGCWLQCASVASVTALLGFVCWIYFCGYFPNVSGNFSTSLEAHWWDSRRKSITASRVSREDITFGLVVIESEERVHFFFFLVW